MRKDEKVLQIRRRCYKYLNKGKVMQKKRRKVYKKGKEGEENRKEEKGQKRRKSTEDK